MKKSEAIGIIYRAAQVYNEQLCNKRLLIIYKAPNDPKFIEAVAAPSNFLHLTGVKSNNISAEDFYNAACGNRLRENDFDFKNNTTEQKLNVLIQTLRISTNAKIIGDFNNGRLNLQTDKLAGSVYSCMGFIKSGDYYIPNTILEDDIRKNINGKQIEKQDSLIAKKDSQISTLLKLSDELAAEKANLEKAIEQRNGVIKRTNLWLNANPDVKARISKDKREHTSVFALKPTENEKQSKSVPKHKDSPKSKR